MIIIVRGIGIVSNFVGEGPFFPHDAGRIIFLRIFIINQV